MPQADDLAMVVTITERRGEFNPAVPLDEIEESRWNPRKHFDPAGLEELAASIREKGVLTPLLLRRVNPGSAVPAESLEIAAGHRRFRAAKMAGLETVPALIREMTDAEFLEVLVIENDQREDVHPLEEAAGYNALTQQGGYDVARIAARVGRSVKYVYDRLKLLQLTPAAQHIFLDNRFTAGHAILLARLSPADQARAIDPNEHDALFTFQGGGLFDESDGADDEPSDPFAHLKPRSVREFEGWIDRHVKVDAEAIDPVLFPEAAEAVDLARGRGEKIIPIMRLDQTPEAARGGERIYTRAAWKRADGAQGSRTCDHGELGIVSIGPGRHEAFTICRKRDRCTVHWRAEMKVKAARQDQAKKATAGGEDPRKVERTNYAEQNRQRKEQEARDDAERVRWTKARPAILEALGAAVKRAPAAAAGPLGRILVAAIDDLYGVRTSALADKVLSRGKTAEDLIRFAALVVLMRELALYRAPQDFPARAKALGIDVRKIVDKAAPVEKPKPAVQTSARGRGKRGGKR